MHPIEHLRHVARAGLVEPGVLAREAARALVPCTAEPAELVVACRRLLERYPAAGPLWWVASTALTATEPRAALADAIHQLDDDPTDAYAAEMRLEGPSCLVPAWALAASGALVSLDGLDEIEAAETAGRSVWVVAGVGVVLPQQVYAHALRQALDAGVHNFGEVPPELITGVVTEHGPLAFDDTAGTSRCPIAPELLGRSRR